MYKAPHVIELPKIHDDRGNLTFIERDRHIPFKIERLFHLYDIPGGATRAGHALKTQEQVIISVLGSFDVVLDNGHEKQTFQLNRSYYGLYVGPMFWRELVNFSSGAVCVVLASGRYDESDYIRDYSQFLASVGV